MVSDTISGSVRDELAAWRESRGLPKYPMAAYRKSGYAERICTERKGGTQAGWST